MNRTHITEQIALSHRLSYDELKLWNILLNHAHDEFYSQDEHHIAVADILAHWSDDKTEDHIKQTLRRLALHVKYTFLSNTKKVLGLFVLLSSAEIYNGVCYYAYARKFKELSHDPQIASYLSCFGLFHDIQSSLPVSLHSPILSYNIQIGSSTKWIN